MKRVSFAALGIVVLYATLAVVFDTPDSVPLASHRTAVADAPLPPDTLAVDEVNAIVTQYCQICHNDALLTGNMTLSTFDAADLPSDWEKVEKMIRKLRAGMMPPPGMPRPDPATLESFVTSLETWLDRHAAENPNPGRRTFQRLNRAEYARAIEGLLGLEVDVSAFLPTETMSHGFDNIADVQMLSATLMEGYLRAADQISTDAVGDPTASARQATYKVPKSQSQMERVEGAPIGTRGGTSVIHNFPADGDYVFKLELHPGPTGFLYGMTATGEELEVSIDGERAALVNIDRWMSESDPNGMRLETEPIHVRAGPHRVTAAFVQRFDGPVDDLITPVDYTLADAMIGSAYGVTTLPHLRDLAISGPFRVTGISETPSRRRVFTCRPTAPEEERPCAESILSGLGEKAYRRPLAERALADLMGFYEMGAEAEGFEGGIRTALKAMLASPHFIFRLEEVPAGAAPGDIYQIAPLDLATRLSFFLWATPPDDRLRELARSGELSEPDVLEAEARRMLGDPRAEALASRFASQWLRLQDLQKIRPDGQLYPYYDQKLADAFDRETELFFHSLVTEDRSLFELLTADYTFVNDRLAEHYGIPGVAGEGFRRVTLTDPNRRGLLGHGSILTLTSHADRTSPVLRGKWVMEVFLGTPPPPPPPDVPDLEATNAAVGGQLLTVRQRMEQHRANPVCHSCHRFMDPIGLALENFDVTGAWRIKDSGAPVDAVGELYDGTELAGPQDLRAALLRRPESFVRTFTTSLMAYALGRRVEYYDMPTIREIARDAEANGNRMSSFILGVVNSPAFRMSRMEAVTQEQGAGQEP